MNPLIKKYCTAVIVTGEECKIPDELYDKKIIKITASPISSLIQTIESMVETEYIVLITNSSTVEKYINVFNATLTEKHICLIKDGIVRGEEAILEYEYLEKELQDEEGNRYFLDQQITAQVYSTKEGQIIIDTREGCFSDEENFQKIYLKSNHEKLGILLPDKYSISKYKYTLKDYYTNDFESAIELLNSILILCRGNTRIPEDILFFNEDILVTSYKENPTPYQVNEFIYKILFGHNLYSDYRVEYIISTLSDMDYDLPDFLLEFIESQFINNNGEENSSIKKLKLWGNVIERYMLSREVL